MKVQVFEILLDDSVQNPHAVYRSGQAVSFRVHLKLLEPVKCRAVYVTLFGHSKVHWTETRSRGSGKSRRSETVHYESEEVYIDQKVAIYTPPSQGSLAEHHPAGEYHYPVAFQIPDTAPSSFEGGIGKIRYFVKANIDRPWRFDTYTQRMYTVIRDLDLNAKPVHLIGPFSTSDEFDVDCCYCFNCCYGRIRVSIALAKMGYVPGEQVHVTGELCNTSATDLESISLEIYQKTMFHARGKTKTTTRVASSIELPGVARGLSVPLNHRLPVNALPSSHIEGCENIVIQYFLRLNVDGGCCLSVKKECCELLIGTIPLWSSVQYAAPPDTLQAPPSYEECMFGRQEIDPAADDGNARGLHGNGQAQWAPSYPVYFSALTPVS